MNNIITCWIVTEGLAGTENQCLGVAEALETTPTVKRIQLTFPWNLLSPYLGFECPKTFIPPLSPPYPDLLITSGRKAIAAARYIKKASSGKSFTLHIQDPRISPKYFDLLAIPAHDPTRGENVIVTTAAPNRITQKRLDDEKKKFPHLASENKMVITVLIGGNSKAYTLTPDLMRHIAQQLKDLQKTHNASLLITTSRRTGRDNEHILRNVLGTADTYIWDGAGDNPYFAMLGYADYILVSADSTSMLSEAATTGKPVYRIDLDALPAGRIAQMHKNLESCGAVRPFTGLLDPPWTYVPLTDSQKVAHALQRALGTRKPLRD
jgi:mitochondrial fission protein ELM1